MVSGVMQQLFSIPESLESSISAYLLLFPHLPKQRKKQKPALRNNAPIDFDKM